MSTTSPLIPIWMRVRMTTLFMPRRNRNCLHMQVGWLQEAPERDPAGSKFESRDQGRVARDWVFDTRKSLVSNLRSASIFLCTAPPFRISPLSLSPVSLHKKRTRR